MTQRIILAGLTATALERLVLNSTAVSLNGTTRAAGGSFLRLSVEGADARYSEGATAPTATTGVLLQADQVYEFSGYNGTSLLKFVKSTAGAIINVMRYKHE